MRLEASPQRRMNHKQLRRLHGLWHRWTGRLTLSRDADRRLRHYYVERFTSGRAHETLELSGRDAVLVVEWLASLVRHAEARINQAAGTAGREGFPERRRVAPNDFAWRALWNCANELGMGYESLDNFVWKHYGRVGLRGLADIHSMADLNRVLWGLKAMLRRREARHSSRVVTKRAA